MNSSLKLTHFLFLILIVCSSCARKPEVEPPPAESEPVQAGNGESTSVDSSSPSDSSPGEEPPTQITNESVYHNPLTDEQKAEGWISLFDGNSLFGWTSTSDEINWSVQDGAIVADAGPIGFLMSHLPFADYELVCEYRMESGGNSGLFLRTTSPPGDIATECYEVNIADEHPDGYTTGSLVNRAKTESPVKRNSDWNEFRVRLQGAMVEVEHNGESLLTYIGEGKVAPSGLIGLQKNAGKIEFRKVILKPLGLNSLFNGNDLSGWREVPGSKSEFKVENGEIHLKNGQGFIETEQTYKDFIFQAQAISHAKELNSGFFFRAMPGTEEAPSNGYEYQIHNGFDGNRTSPNNAGTGAIFRRVDARYVVADDLKWFTATLIAHGNRIGCWVDGYHVVDWVDDRKPDPNPRRGQRLEAGHISIQGHDPTTDLSFRNLSIAEYPARSASSDQ